jgi:hypothetical protein
LCVKSKGVYQRLFTERIEIAHAKLHNMFVQRSNIIKESWAAPR